MKRKFKVALVANTIKEHSFGVQLSEREYRWIAEHIIDALKDAKRSLKEDKKLNNDGK